MLCRRLCRLLFVLNDVFIFRIKNRKVYKQKYEKHTDMAYVTRYRNTKKFQNGTRNMPKKSFAYRNVS